VPEVNPGGSVSSHGTSLLPNAFWVAQVGRVLQCSDFRALPPHGLPWQTLTYCDASPVAPRLRYLFTGTKLRYQALRKPFAGNVTALETMGAVCDACYDCEPVLCALRNVKLNEPQRDHPPQAIRTFSRRYRTRLHASVIVVEMSQQERAWPQHGRGCRTQRPLRPRPSAKQPYRTHRAQPIRAAAGKMTHPAAFP
jgi:hypothetical protein